MDKTINLRILTTKGLAFEGEVDELYVRASAGPVGILRGHTPYLASLPEYGTLRFTARSSVGYYVVKRGALEVKGENVLVMSHEVIQAKSEEDAKGIIEKLKSEEQ